MKEDRSWTEIDLSNFEHNLTELKKFLPSGTDFMQIVKADAYGHGAFEIAKKAIQFGATFLGVANFQEGLLLRYQGLEIPILILSPSMENEIDQILDNELTPTISDQNFAETLNKKAKKPVPFHINIDTGMGRSGIEFKSAESLIKNVQKLKNLKIEGIYSHFSAAENDEEFTYLQSQRFQKILSELDFTPKFIHIANSSGVITSKCKYANLVRIGLLSYGIYPDPKINEKIELKPVMTFKSRISQFKTGGKGDFVGYNRTYQASANLRYAILPVGYADGYDFLLSNKGKVLIKDQLCNVIGKVSMDMIAVDVTDITVEIGDEAILLGGANEKIKAENLTSIYGGSSYELLCQIGRRAKRYYFENGDLIASSPLLRRDFVSLDYSDDKLNNVIETAIEQRLQSKEISSLIYSDILKRYFAEHDKDINYRRNFKHSIEFKEHNRVELANYYLTKTTLTFTKKLQNDYFYVACANNEELLEKYFLRKDVEYRWLLDSNLKAALFDVTSVKVNEFELYSEMKLDDGCLEIRCFHSELKNLKDQEVEFSISTQTYYPKNSHQLAVYLIEMTQGVQIEFKYNNLFSKVEAVPIFSGRSKFPQISSKANSIKVSSKKEEWIFPTSGVVFVY
jgi:alanine racemase